MNQRIKDGIQLILSITSIVIAFQAYNLNQKIAIYNKYHDIKNEQVETNYHYNENIQPIRNSLSKLKVIALSLEKDPTNYDQKLIKITLDEFHNNIIEYSKIDVDTKNFIDLIVRKFEQLIKSERSVYKMEDTIIIIDMLLDIEFKEKG